MDAQKVDMYLMANAKFFPNEKIPMLKEHLTRLDESRFTMLISLNMKDPTVILVVSLLVGHFGIDRFMLGQTGLGIAKLLTCGGLGIWTIVDWFLVMQRAREMNFENLIRSTI